MSTEITIKELRQAAGSAFVARADVESERKRYVNGLVDAYKKVVEREADGFFKERIKDAWEIERAADSALAQRIDEDALAGVGALLPVGTVLVEWRTNQRSWPGPNAPPLVFHKTGRTARYIAVTRDTKLPASLTYNAPDPGEFVIQINKKDGTPGVQLVTSGGDKRAYYVEGANPNVEGTKSPFADRY